MIWLYQSVTLTGNLHDAVRVINEQYSDMDVVGMDTVGMYTIVVFRRPLLTERRLVARVLQVGMDHSDLTAEQSERVASHIDRLLREPR